MRSSKSRSRSKSNRQRSVGNIINRVFDSSGPEGKVRGTPQQIIDKYLMLARDAQLGNDRVAEQNFLQHAEHYTRMLGEAQRELAREQESRQAEQQARQNDRQPERDRDRGEGRRDAPEPVMPVLGEDEGGPVETPEAADPQPRRDRQERGDRSDRGERNERAESGERSERGDRAERAPRAPRPPRREDADSGAALPAFVTGVEADAPRPARAPRAPRKPAPKPAPEAPAQE